MNIETRQRLLDTAERLFALKGFHGTSVREITSQAGVHLSAVNYHFGSKKELYIAVFKERFAARAKKVQELIHQQLTEPVTPHQAIQALSRAALMGPFSEDERKIHYLLLARELTEPSEAFGIIVEEAILPIVSEIEKALSESREPVLSTLSVLAQVLFFNFARILVSQLTGKEYTEKFLEELVEHICGFSLQGYCY